MSSRALRKQLQSSRSAPPKKEEKPEKDESESEESEDDEPTVTFKNPFDLLGGGGGGGSSANDDDDDDDSDESEESKSLPPKPETPKQSAKPSASKKGAALSQSKKGAQKNLKSSQQKQESDGIEEDPEQAARRKKKEDEEFDQLLKQFGSQDRQKVASVGQTETKTKQILEIDSKYLDPTVEIKQMFGSKVLVHHAIAERGGHIPRQQLQQQRRAVLRSRRMALKKTHLVKPRESWPPLDGGLEMELVESKNGVNYFRFVWGTAHKEAQKHFFVCVQTGDPNTLARLLHKYPYHADSLLQLYEALKITGDLDAAEDLLERLLYRFETAWHARFDPLTQANNRLPYKYYENRSWYLGLFTRIELLGRRGCIKTALESCKLLLSFDLEDPLGMFFMLDHFALRTKSYEWINRAFASAMFEEKGLSTLPNWVFSCALATFMMQGTLSSSSSDNSVSDALENAIIMFPSLVPALLQKISIKSLPNNAHAHRFFAESEKSAPLGVRLQIALYVERNHQFWREDPALGWLKNAVQAVIKRVDADDPMVANSQAIIADTYPSEELPANLKRHILLSDFSGVVNMLPQHVLRDGFQIYDDPDFMAQQQREQVEQGGVMSHPLAQFLASLLPWGNGNGPQAPALDQNALAELFGALGMAAPGDDDDEEDEEHM